MRFLNQQPYGYGGHNTGGEHVVKHHYDPDVINDLRLQENPSLDSWDSDEVRGIMADSGFKGELVNAYSEADGNLKMVGGLLLRYEYPEPGNERVAVVDASDIIVAPEHRGKGIGTYLISKAISSQPYSPRSTPYPTEIVVTDRNKILGPKSSLDLAKSGFTMKDETRHPKMLLAGWELHGKPDFEDIRAYDDVVERMPTSWNGYFEVAGEFHGRPEGEHVFRRGRYVGAVKAGEEVHYDDEDRSFTTYDYYDSANNVIARTVAQPTNPFFAASDLVNRLAEEA